MICCNASCTLVRWDYLTARVFIMDTFLPSCDRTSCVWIPFLFKWAWIGWASVWKLLEFSWGSILDGGNSFCQLRKTFIFCVRLFYFLILAFRLWLELEEQRMWNHVIIVCGGPIQVNLLFIVNIFSLYKLFFRSWL